MHRRALILFAAVLAVPIAHWFLWPRGEVPRPIPLGEPANIARAQSSQDPPDIEAVTASPEADATRESVVPAAPETTQAQAASFAEKEAIATLLVRVTEEASGAALAGVRLSVSPGEPVEMWISSHVASSKGTPNTSPITGDDGRVEFELPAGVEYQLSGTSERGNAGGAHVDLRALLPGERHEVTLRIPTGLDLHYFGRVLDREALTPIPGASVNPVPGGRSTTWKSRLKKDAARPDVQTTDGQGRFELWCQSWAGVDLQVDAPGYASTFVAAVKDHDTPETATEILLSRAGSLRARLLDAGGGVLADGSVRLWTESYNIGAEDEGQSFATDDPEWGGSVDPSGFCVLQGLPPTTPFHVEILRGRKVVKKDLPTISLNPGEVREVEWRLGSGCRLSVLLVEQDGTPVGDQEVWVARAEFDVATYFETDDSNDATFKGASDSAGRFSFSDVAPGRWWIGPAPGRSGFAPYAEVIEIPDGATEQDVIVRLHRGLFIRGVVLDPSGKPKTETYVFGSLEGVRSTSLVETGSDGTFTMGPLVPGRYVLAAHGWEDADSDSVEAKAGDEGIVLRLKTAGSIRGTVVDGASGKACPANVTYSMQASDQGFGTVSPEIDGTFRIKGLEPGTYDLVATASGTRIGVMNGLSVQSAIETSDVVISLVPGATLSVRYAGAEGYLYYQVVSGGMVVGGDGIPAGGREVITVPAGRIVVEFASGRKELESRELDLSVGAHEELVLGGPITK